jgi:hypothetical protein
MATFLVNCPVINASILRNSSLLTDGAAMEPLRDDSCPTSRVMCGACLYASRPT